MSIVDSDWVDLVSVGQDAVSIRNVKLALACSAALVHHDCLTAMDFLVVLLGGSKSGSHEQVQAHDEIETNRHWFVHGMVET